MSEPEELFELRVAWQRQDPAIERDADLFWSANKVLPQSASVSDRLNEICIVAYAERALVAVSTAVVRYVAFLGARLAMFRCSISTEYRGKKLSYAMMTRAREVLEEWSAAHPEEKVMGMTTVAQTQTAYLGDGPGVFKGSGLTFVGWTANGERMRVAWFDHATIPRSPPGSRAQS